MRQISSRNKSQYLSPFSLVVSSYRSYTSYARRRPNATLSPGLATHKELIEKLMHEIFFVPTKYAGANLKVAQLDSAEKSSRTVRGTFEPVAVDSNQSTAKEASQMTDSNRQADTSQAPTSASDSTCPSTSTCPPLVTANFDPDSDDYESESDSDTDDSTTNELTAAELDILTARTSDGRLQPRERVDAAMMLFGMANGAYHCCR